MLSTEFKKRTGVYLIKIGTHQYVGSAARCFYLRQHQHLSDLKLGKHSNAKMQNSFNKYKEFSFEVLEEWESDICVAMEQYWMNLLQPDLNINKVASSRLGSKVANPKRGRKVSEEGRQRIRDARKLQIIPRSTIDAMHKAHRRSVIDHTGQEFNSVKEAAGFWSIPIPTACHILSGKIKKHRDGIVLKYKEIK